MISPNPNLDTSEVLSRGENGKPEAAKVTSKSRLGNKGKGKEKEVVEETLQKQQEL